MIAFANRDTTGSHSCSLCLPVQRCRNRQVATRFCGLGLSLLPVPVSGGQDSEKHWQLVMRPKVQAGYLPVELIHLHALAE